MGSPIYPATSHPSSVAMGGTSARARSLAASEVSLPAAPPPAAVHARVSLRSLKDLVGRLAPDHPLRILIAGEPDEMPQPEFASKVVGWYRLLREVPRTA